MKIYLAGGMATEWRGFVTGSCGWATFYDPTLSGLDFPSGYTMWDLRAIADSDIVLGYFEKSNPSGIGLACEIGYAKGLGKMIILVNEQPENKYFDFVMNVGVIKCDTLDQAISLLGALYESNFYHQDEW